MVSIDEEINRSVEVEEKKKLRNGIIYHSKSVDSFTKQRIHNFITCINRIQIVEWNIKHQSRKKKVQENNHEQWKFSSQVYELRNTNSSLSSISLPTQTKRYTTFVIDIEVERGPKWKIERRYREFREFHKLLKRKYATIRKECYFPPRRFLSSLTLHVIERREKHLEKYLNDLLNMRPRPYELGSFLEVEKNLNIIDNLYNIISISSSESEDIDNHIVCNWEKNIQPDHFNFVNILGKGSFGKVFLVSSKDNPMKYYAMKVLQKSELKHRNQIFHTMTERRIMSELNHPFIIQLKYAFQTKDHLFMVSDYCCGGELFFHLKKFRTFSEKMVKFYSAELICCLHYLHERGIVYRDLKPENILLDETGHIKLIDFGLSKENVYMKKGAHTFCGTPEYLSPEMLESKKLGTEYGQTVDYWALGVLMYEMLTGWPPFYNPQLRNMCNKILYGELKFPTRLRLSRSIKDLIHGLLQRNILLRLGCNDINKLKYHEFYHDINWELLLQKKIQPPFKPRISYPTDLRNFDKEMAKEIGPFHYLLYQDDKMEYNKEDDAFAGFSYIPPTRNLSNKMNRNRSISIT